MKVFLATKNKGKIKDFENLTEGMNLEVVTILDGIEIPDVIENGETFEENSIKKSREIADYTNIVTIIKLGVPVVAQWKRIRLGTMRLRV